MTEAPPDLIAGYLADLCTGLRVPDAEAELILAEAEDHLRETAAAGRETGMTELEAQQRAISSFGPARAVARAHRRRPLTVGGAAMAAWKLTGLLATIVGAGGVAGMEMFEFKLRSAPPPPSPPGANPLVIVYAAIAAGGVVLLAARWLARRGTSDKDLLSPGVTAGCLLLASPVLLIYGTWLRSASPPMGPPPAAPPELLCPYSCNWSGSPVPDSAFGPAPTVLAVYAAMAAGILILLAVRWLARRGIPRPLLLAARRLPPPGALGRRPLSPQASAMCFLLASAPLLVLIVIRAHVVKGEAVPLAPMINVSWLTPVSQGTVSAAPLVSGAIVAGCLAAAAGFGVQAALRRARRKPGQGRLLKYVLRQAGRGQVGHAYV